MSRYLKLPAFIRLFILDCGNVNCLFLFSAKHPSWQINICLCVWLFVWKLKVTAYQKLT